MPTRKEDPERTPGRHAPATARNREPLVAILAEVLPRGLILEVASGSGEHSCYFAQTLPGRTFQPTDPDPEALESIEAWRRFHDLDETKVRAPLRLDVTEPWPIDRCDAVFCANMIHIAAPEATPALMAGASKVLSAGGVLVTYGPYRIDGEQTSESNVRFEGWLKSLDPRFGVRDMGEVADIAATHGLHLEKKMPMPANNFTLVFRRA